ncbi:DUF3192 domain-containing protein [Shewanella sp. NIFS-20-20]|uniref:DUF3192 domain-containing protein n=1 Tax=Shewanella sp. NIFS-20-20 TaxID=2853806 RepID=UPI001C45D763|nr:DUF3192 domain-containing protein [Shewanella sp. NIFS-20-20]MBV7315788.1 DUF3192 domain-containing protein [Shewanella sp. NIFS-20-20]
MKKTRFPLLTAVGLSLGLSGCVINLGGDESGYASGQSSSWQQQERQNRDHIANLSLGASLESVKQSMGLADFSEAYPDGDKTVEVLFYRTQRRHGDDKTTMDECTPLVFNNGKLVGWGNTAYHQVKSI